MKVKSILLLSILLIAIITFGAVSATEDVDSLADTVDDETIAIDDGIEEISDDGDEKSEVYYSMDCPEDNALPGTNQRLGVLVEYSNALGNVTISVDGEQLYNEVAKPYKYDDELEEQVGGNYIYIDDLGLSFEKHTYEIKFLGDDRYYGFNETGEFNYDYIYLDVPEEIRNYDDIYVSTASDLNDGEIIFEIDGNEVKTFDVSEYDHSIALTIEDLELGNHTYVVTYTGGENYPERKFTGSFNLTYRFYALSDDDYEEFWPGMSMSYYVYLPSDASNDILITFNGVSRKVTPAEDETYVTFENFKVGKNVITFTYSDDKYPKKTFNITINIHPVLRIADEIESGSGRGVTMVVPEDAKGNLVVTKEVYNKSTYEYEYVTIATVPVVNGNASYDLSTMSLGRHNIRAYYDGDDYGDSMYLDSGSSVDIILATEIPNSIWNGEVNNITVSIPESESGKNLTLFVRSQEGYWDVDDWAYEILEVLYDGPASGNIVVSIPKLDADVYTVEMVYGGNSQSKDIEVRNISRDFDFDVKFPANIIKSSDYIILKEFPSYVDGRVYLYIDGNEVDDYWADRAVSMYYDFDNLELGQHTWKIVFIEDSYFNDISKSGTFTVDWVKIADSINIGDDIEVRLNEGDEGSVVLVIDGKEYAMEFLDYNSLYITVDDLSIGKHDYEISYLNDNGETVYSKSGSFELNYYLGTNIYDDEVYPVTDAFEIEIYVPDDATGDVLVSYNGNNYTAEPVNGTAKVILKDLSEGTEKVTVKYVGDDKYPEKTVSETLTFEGYRILPKYQNDNSGYIESVSLFLPNADGSLVVKIDDEIYKSQPLVNGKAVIEIADLDVGYHNIEAYYDGEAQIDWFSDSISVIPNVDGDFDLGVGQSGTITVDLPANLKGNFIAYLDDEEIYNEAVPADGKVSIPIEGLSMGDYTLSFDYTGDDMVDVFRWYDEYDGTQYREYYLSVSPKNITIPHAIFSENDNIGLELADDAKGTITVYVDGDKYTTVDVNGPKVDISLKDVDSGYHHVRVVYEDEKYGSYSTSNEIMVAKPKPTATTTAPDSATAAPAFTIELPSDATGRLIVSVNGKNYAKALVDGKATIEIDEAEGTYNATIKYSGDSQYAGFTQTQNVTVQKGYDPKIVAKQSSVLYTGKYSVTVYGADAKLASGVDVAFYINGKLVKTVKTNSKGVATFSVPSKYVIKKYTIKATALDKSVSKKVSVKQILSIKKVTVKKSAKKLVLTATLKKVNGKYLKNKKITFKFNGKKYTAKTNKKGVAKVTVKKSVLKKLKVGKKIKYQATYLKVTVKKTVKVKR